MNYITMQTSTKFLLSVLLVTVILVSPVKNLHATTIAAYDFNTAGDLLNHFTPDAANNFAESVNGGISDTPAVLVDANSGMYVAKYAMTNAPVGETFTISGYFYNDGNSGYGGIGFITNTSAEQSNAIPLTTTGLGAYFHGGGGGFISNSSDIQTLNWDGGDLNDAAWYKLVFSFTQTAANEYDIVVQIWNANSDGSLGSKKTEHTYSVTNSDFAGAPVIRPYFLTDGGDRFVYVDNIDVTDQPVITPAPAFSGSGAGTSGDPYVITSCLQLQEMENHLAADYLLGNDIDCSMTNPDDSDFDDNGTWADGKGFRPVGDNNDQFTGNFDGGNYTISGLYIDRADDTSGEGPDDESYVGIFGYTSSSTISHFDVVDSKVKGYVYVGGIVGYADSTTIEDVSFNATTEDNTCDPGNCVWARFGTYGGGIAGFLNQGMLTGVTTSGPVKGSGNVIGGLLGGTSSSEIYDSSSSSNIDGGGNLGGIVGDATNSYFENVYATGNVLVVEEQSFGKEGSNGGGFVGYSQNTEYVDSYATGTVTGLNNIGGFAGTIYGGQVTGSYATGLVDGSSSYTGGFAGFSGCGTGFTRVYATGAVSGNDAVGGFSGLDGCEGPGSTFNEVFASGNVSGQSSVGGFIGQSYYSSITDAYATGAVTAGNNIGGFIGYSYDSTLDRAYSSGIVTTTGDTNMGGFIGENPNNDTQITDSFWDGDKTSLTETCGNGALCSGATKSTTTLMNTELTFTDASWDFNGVWKMDSSNGGYPYFDWQIPSDTTAPVLTVVTPINKKTSIKNAVLTFTTSEACEISAAPISVSDGSSAELLIEDTVPSTDIHATIRGMKQGVTYSFSFTCTDDAGNESNTIDSGEFTIEKPIVIGYKPPQGKPSQQEESKTPFSQKGECSADQLITENLKAPSRNGFYNSYTGKKVTQANRLQAHLNRLGFNAGPVDGIIGPLSTAAIKRMQTFLGTPADGYVGPLTRALINNSCEEKKV